MNKLSSDRRGRPWTSPVHDAARVYSPDMCPQTLDVLGRAVTITISQKWERKHVDWTVEAIRKVAAQREKLQGGE